MSNSGPSLPEYVRSGLAAFVVVFGFVLIAYAWSSRGISDSKELAAIFLGVIGIVMGYYFGRQGVERAQEIAALQTQEKRLTQLKTLNYDALKAQNEALERSVTRYERLLEKVSKDSELKRKIEELLTQVSGQDSEGEAGED